MAKGGTISKNQAIEQIASQLDGPLSSEAFVDRVLAIWPSKAKNPRGSVRSAIKVEHNGKNLLFLDEHTLVPMRLGMRRVCFRVPLSRQEVNRGLLFFYPSFQLLHHRGLAPENFRLEDLDGLSIPVEIISLKSKVKNFFGVDEFENVAFDLGWWYRKHRVGRKDSLLITVLDWEAGRYRLHPESAREYKKHRDEIQDRNKDFSDLLFELLESAKYDNVWDWVAVPTAYARLKDPQAYPADHWQNIIEADDRLAWNGYEIHYPERRSALDAFFSETAGRPASKPKPLSQSQAGQVYRFKAFLWHRKGLWRRIEILGGQSLADFDRVLRKAFHHDTFDHLSGFWKLVRRGDTRRFREVDLGNINPFEEGGAGEIRIADLEMELGEALKYVYDFGDWIEHRVELEAVGEPKAEAQYPRITEQNKPRYKYCEVCEQEDKKTTATWICLTCSNREEREVLLCKDHMYEHDEEHYEEEMIY